MDYLSIYNALIQDAKTNPKSDSYKEIHHIIPKCMGGSNRKDNLVLLTARQHFIAHWLLYKIHRTSAMVYAWNNMCRIGKGQESRRINSRHFKYVREAFSQKIKNMPEETRRKISNSLKGKPLAEETKKKIAEAFNNMPEDIKIEKYKKLSDSLKGNKHLLGHKHSEETRKKMSDSLKGKKHSAETRKKISESRKGKTYKKPKQGS